MTVICKSIAITHNAMEQTDQASSNDPVLRHIDERGVAYLTLNQPQVYNADNGDMIIALLAAFDKFKYIRLPVSAHL